MLSHSSRRVRRLKLSPYRFLKQQQQKDKMFFLSYKLFVAERQHHTSAADEENTKSLRPNSLLPYHRLLQLKLEKQTTMPVLQYCRIRSSNWFIPLNLTPKSSSNGDDELSMFPIKLH